MDEKDLIIKSEDKSDIVSKNKTIYDASAGEILWKNFLAGFGRGLGGIIIYLIFLSIIGLLFYNFILPKIMPSITGFMDIFKSVGSIPNAKSGSGNPIPVNLDIQKLLGQ